MAGIKISDLSVGDWIATVSAQLTIEGDDIATAFVDKVKKPIQIVSVLGDEQLVFGRIEELDGFTTIYLKAEHIEPIPLTPEILEKNGFEENCGRWYNSEALMEFEQYKDGWCRTINCGEYSVYFIKYVHQLQHALRLAGVEKEIVI